MRPADTLEAIQADAQRLMEKHRRRLEALTTENAERKVTPTEAVAIGRLIEEKHPKAVVSAARPQVATDTTCPERSGDLPEIAPARPDRSRNGVLYAVVADDEACGFPLEGLPSAGPEPLLWEEFLGRKEVFLG